MRRAAKASLPPIAPPQPAPGDNRQRKRGLNDIFSIVSAGQHGTDNSKHMFVYYENSTGTIAHLINDMLMDVTEQRAWLTVWMKLDPGNNFSMCVRTVVINLCI
jgi:hypothetical protein